jgi:hypothetical protein
VSWLRPGAPSTGMGSNNARTTPNIWVDREVAELEGINVERLAAYYALAGINIVVEQPINNQDGTRTCPCCKQHKASTAAHWRPTNLTDDGMADLCRVCEGTEIADTVHTLRYYADKEKRDAVNAAARERRAAERAAAGLPPLTRDRSGKSKEAKRRERNANLRKERVAEGKTPGRPIRFTRGEK